MSGTHGKFKLINLNWQSKVTENRPWRESWTCTPPRRSNYPSDPHPLGKNSGSAHVTGLHTIRFKAYFRICTRTNFWGDVYLIFPTVPSQGWSPQAYNRLKTADIDIRKDPRWRDLLLTCRKMNISCIFLNIIYWLHIFNRVTIDHYLNETLTFALSSLNILSSFFYIDTRPTSVYVYLTSWIIHKGWKEA